MVRPSFLVIILSLATSLRCENLPEQNDGCLTGFRHARASVRHIEAGGIGYKTGYTTLETFIASDPEWRVMPFLDLRGHVFNDGKFAANAGIGSRFICGCRAYGVNAYYDYRSTHHRQYNQIGLGLETLGQLWDFRINGYLPIKGKISHPYHIAFKDFSGHSILVNRKFQYAMKGLDGEALFHFGKTPSFDFYGAAGPYYFKGKLGKAAIGAKARIAGSYKEYITLELSDSWDSVFKNNVQGQLTLSLPFGPKSHPKMKESCPNTCDLAIRMVQPVSRQEIVVVDTHTKTDRASAFVIFVNNESHSAGTYESPFPTLREALAASKPDDIIYIFPGDGTSTGLNAFGTPFALKDNQLLLGAGTDQVVSTNLGTITIPAQATLRPSLTADDGTSVVQITNGNTVSGLQIASNADGTDNGSYCIGSSSGTATHLTVSNNHLIANNGAIGIFPNNLSGQTTITRNTIQSTDLLGTFGIYLTQTSGSGTFDIENNTISDFQNINITSPSLPISGSGIAVLVQNQASVNAIIRGNQTNLCRGHAIDLHAVTGSPSIVALVENNQLQGPIDAYGFFTYTDGTADENFRLLNNTITGISFGVIAEAEENSAMTGLIQNNALSHGLSATGIIVETNFLTTSDAATGIFTILSNDVYSYESQGIATAAYGSSSLTARIENNTIHGEPHAGLYLKGFNSSTSNLTIINNIIYNNNVGMEISPSDDATIIASVERNTIYNNEGAGITVLPNLNGSGAYEIISNILHGNNISDLNDGSAVTMIAEDSSNICLRMNDNESTAEVTLPDYFLQNTGSGLFNVEPLVGNVGTVQESGTTSVPSGYCSP